MLTLALPSVAILGAVFFITARSKAISLAGGSPRKVHSRPNYHGFLAFLLAVLAGWAVLLVVGVGWGAYTERNLSDALNAAGTFSPIEVELIINAALAISQGGIASKVDPLREQIAAKMADQATARGWGTFVLSIGAAALFGL